MFLELVACQQLKKGKSARAVARDTGLPYSTVRRLAEGDRRVRCPECRTSRVDKRAMSMHVFKCKRPICHCMRVPYPHRPGGFLFCEQHPHSDLAWAQLQGASDEQLDDIALDLILSGRVKGNGSAECPF